MYLFHAWDIIKKTEWPIYVAPVPHPDFLRPGSNRSAATIKQVPVVQSFICVPFPTHQISAEYYTQLSWNNMKYTDHINMYKT